MKPVPEGELSIARPSVKSPIRCAEFVDPPPTFPFPRFNAPFPRPILFSGYAPERMEGRRGLTLQLSQRSRHAADLFRTGKLESSPLVIDRRKPLGLLKFLRARSCMNRISSIPRRFLGIKVERLCCMTLRTSSNGRESATVALGSHYVQLTFTLDLRSC